MRVAKWGNSLALRLPASVVNDLDLEIGSSVEVRAVDKNTLEISRSVTREEALKSLEAIGAKLPRNYKFNREEANAR